MKQRLFLFLTLFLVKSVGFAQALTSSEQTARNNYEQASAVLAQVMNNPQAKKVVLAGILSGAYVDECVLFSDLMNPSQSKAYMGNAYLGDTPSASFANEFNRVLASGTYPGSDKVTKNPNLVNDLIASKTRVYFPYSENYVRDANYTGIFTCTFNPVTEDESNAGVISRDGRTFTTVRVDEAYTLVNPTLIVTLFEGNPESTGTTGPYTPANVTSRGSGGTTDCSQPPTRMAVYVQEMRFESQWDNIFKGGPEFYVGRGDLQYNSAGTQITAGTAVTNLLSFKRSDKGKWKSVTTLWDPRWEFDLGNFEELEQHIFCYEEDDNSSTTLSLTGGYKLDVKLPKIGGVEQSISGTASHTYNEDDDVVFVQQWDRCWFINTNTTNQGLGIQNGRAVRGTGGNDSVKLTMRIDPW